MRKAAVGIKCDVRKYTYFVVVFLQLLLSDFGSIYTKKIYVGGFLFGATGVKNKNHQTPRPPNTVTQYRIN